MMRFLVKLVRCESEEQLPIRVSEQKRSFDFMIGIASGFRISSPPDIAPPRFDVVSVMKIFRVTFQNRRPSYDLFPNLKASDTFDLVLHQAPYNYYLLT